MEGNVIFVVYLLDASKHPGGGQWCDNEMDKTDDRDERERCVR